MKRILMLTTLLLLTPMLAQANAIPEMMEKYKAEGGSNFSAAAGKAMWTKKVMAEDGSQRSCATCHTADPTKTGTHKKTGKLIAAMALSVPFVAMSERDAPRFSKAKKIRKWFKRNCKWTYGRECTAQEKGDFLTYLKNL